MHPFSLPGRFLRGNLHTHSDRSDGVLPPAEVAARYRANGYDFLAITDHLRAKDGWRITDVADLNASGGLSKPGDLNASGDLGTPGFTVIRGAELHGPALANGEPWHIVAVGLPDDFPTGADETTPATGPELARRALEAGAFVVAAHPAWYGATAADILTLGPVHAVEVYNVACAGLNDRGDSWQVYNELLAGGARFGVCVADDAHFNVPFDAFRAWVMVKAESEDAAGIVAALKAGAYYSSTGPEIRDLRWEDGVLHLACSPVERVYISGVGRRAQTVFGTNLTRASIRPNGVVGPVARLTLVDAAGRRAWTNLFDVRSHS